MLRWWTPATAAMRLEQTVELVASTLDTQPLTHVLNTPTCTVTTAAAMPPCRRAGRRCKTWIAPGQAAQVQELGPRGPELHPHRPVLSPFSGRRCAAARQHGHPGRAALAGCTPRPAMTRTPSCCSSPSAGC